jgi:hypothetical protein
MWFDEYISFIFLSSSKLSFNLFPPWNHFKAVVRVAKMKIHLLAQFAVFHSCFHWVSFHKAKYFFFILQHLSLFRAIISFAATIPTENCST